MRKTQGFTLIELMVVIAIIAILATVGLVSYSNAQKSARDSKRKQDLQAVAVAMESYYNANHQYPHFNPVGPETTIWCPCWSNSGTSGVGTNWLNSGVTPYLNQIPVDPINKLSSTSLPAAYTNSYFYAATGGNWGASYPGCTNGHRYALLTMLENNNDPDSAQNKPVKWCDGVQINTSSVGNSHYSPPNSYLIVVHD